jgi:hypothetical protein
VGRYHRIVSAQTREMIGEALALLPPKIAERLGDVPFFEGDYVFAGVSRDWGDYDHEYGGRRVTGRRRDSATCFSHAQGPADFAHSWISLPFPKAGYPNVGVVLHELGHALANAAIRPHARPLRVYAGQVSVQVDYGSSGMIPPFRSFTSYEPASLHEQFAEAFRIWLSPPELLRASWEPEQFFIPEREITDFGFRSCNRGLLAFFNELADQPVDLAPLALR